MSLRVVDTDVVSYLFRGREAAARYRPHVAGHTLLISFMTVAELYELTARRSWSGARLARLEANLRSYVVVPSSNDLAKTWGRVRAERRHQPISVADGWIAATALARGCPLVTNNAADFQGIAGLTVISAPPGA